MENSKQQLIEKLESLLGNDNVNALKTEVEDIKAKFYALYNQEQENLKKVAEEQAALANEVLENWQPDIDELELKFRELLNVYKQKRAEATKKAEEQMKQNQLVKENIIAQLEELASQENADVMGNIQKVKDLQAQWKATGEVTPALNQKIWKRYNQLLEQFYDLVKLNIELRDLDFKKNLEFKNALIAKAEQLKDNPNAVESSRVLQQLHKEWAEIGPVAKELREEVWGRFKEISSFINKKHQAFFEELHGKEKENLTQKQALIEQIKALDWNSLKTMKQWNDALEKILAIQEEWRKIGFAPKKVNQKIYKEYRTLCDEFFKAKNLFFKQMHGELSENLKKKRELLQKAEELKNSTDWQKTTETLIQLQKEWKKVGAVARKYSDDLWKRFTQACDDFFEAKRANDPSEATKDNENRNLADRNKLLRQYDKIKQELTTAENNILFFTTKSKGKNALLDGVQSKIKTLQDKLAEIDKKLRELDKPAPKATEVEKKAEPKAEKATSKEAPEETPTIPVEEQTTTVAESASDEKPAKKAPKAADKTPEEPVEAETADEKPTVE